MALTHRSVLEFGLDPSARLFTQSFADYFVPVQMSPAGLSAMARQDSVDLGASRIVLDHGQPVGVALVARRGWTSRLAAMAVLPEARARGVGKHLVRQLLAEAKGRGERSMTLEVIEQNTPAARLYAKCGFRTIRRLIGFAGRPQVEATERQPAEVDLWEVARALIAHGPPDLPWQLSGETLAQSGPPGVAYRDRDALIALSDPTAPAVVVRALVTLPHARRRGLALSLLRAVISRCPDREWRVSAIWPEELGGLFERLGLQRVSLSQWQMTIDLTGGPGSDA